MSLLLTLGLGATGAAPTPPTGGNTPYMSLLLPTVSVTLGPLYATEVNQAFLRVDQHDHSSGFGRQVGSNGLNINADLSFHGFNLLNLNSAQFNVQSPTSGLTGQIYMSGQDLYCKDGAGNIIQITAAGAVNIVGLVGGWTGLSAPAQASYNNVTKKFALQSNTTGPVYGHLAVGDILLYPGDPNLGTLPYIQLSTPAAGVSTYTFSFPKAAPAPTTQKLIALDSTGQCQLVPATLPGSGLQFMRMDNLGNVVADTVFNPSFTLTTASGLTTVSLTAGAITSAQLGSQSVTADKLVTAAPASGGTPSAILYGQNGVNGVTLGPVYLTAQSSPAYPTSNARPIVVTFGPRYDGGSSAFRVFSNFPQLTFTIKIDGSQNIPGAPSWQFDAWNNGSAQNYSPWTSFIIPPGTIAAGAHNWTITVSSTGTNFNLFCSFSVAEL